jgi:hypothetical protein
MKLDHKLRAVSLMLQTACDFVIAFTATANAPDSRDADSLQLLSTLWAQKMDNRHLSFEAELASNVRIIAASHSFPIALQPSSSRADHSRYSMPVQCSMHDNWTVLSNVQVSTGYGAMYIVILAIDTITALVHSVAHIVDRSSSDDPNLPLEATRTAAPHTPPDHPIRAASIPPADSVLEPASPSALCSPCSMRPSSDAAGGTGQLDSPRMALHKVSSNIKAVVPKKSLAAEARFSVAHTSQLAQEQIWAELVAPTDQHGHLLLDIVWQSSLEVCDCKRAWMPYFCCVCTLRALPLNRARRSAPPRLHFYDTCLRLSQSDPQVPSPCRYWCPLPLIIPRCTSLVCAMQVLTEVMIAVSGEALVVHLLRAFQAMATVAGVLKSDDILLAYLSAVCSFSVDAPIGSVVALDRSSSSRMLTSPAQQDSRQDTHLSIEGSPLSGALPLRTRPYVAAPLIPSCCRVCHLWCIRCIMFGDADSV